MRTVPAGMELHRGGWGLGDQFPAGNWFSPDFDMAAQYIAERHAASEGRRPFVYSGVVLRPQTLLVLDGDHIAHFNQAYGRQFFHRWLPRDLPEVFERLGLGDVGGFLRPNTSEFFILSPEKVFGRLGVVVDDAALAEVERIKGEGFPAPWRCAEHT